MVDPQSLPAMIVSPDRLELLAKAIEAGEPLTPDMLRRVALLQTIDLVSAGAAYVEQAARRQLDTDTMLHEQLAGTIAQPVQQ